MPYDVLTYAAYKYMQSKKRKAKKKAKALRQTKTHQEFLELLTASKTTNLSEKDAQLLISNETIEYGSEQDNYLGLPFGTIDDYVEVLIYDTQNNFLESGVADKSDYFYDEEEGGIKLKTGTILRKMGYDRGRFKVMYNFLRKMGGSYETIVTDKEGKIYNGEVDENEIGNSLFIKENKYNIHKISDSRTELRLLPQNIIDENYLRRFYKLGSKVTKYQADETPISNIEFKGTDEQKPTSKLIKFIGTTGHNEGQFDKIMTGGKIMIPNFFVTRKVEMSVATSGADLGYDDYEIVGTNEQRASFRIVELIVGSPKLNNANQPGDRYLGAHHTYFQGYKKDDIIVNPVTGEQMPSENKADHQATLNIGINTDKQLETGKNWIKTPLASTGRIENIVALEEPNFDRIFFKQSSGAVTVDLESNSTFFTNTTVTYTWEFFGWDLDRKRNWANKTVGWNMYILKRKYKPDGGDNGGDISIDSVSDNSLYATEDSTGNGMRGSVTIDPEDRDVTTYAPDTRPG